MTCLSTFCHSINIRAWPSLFCALPSLRIQSKLKAIIMAKLGALLILGASLFVGTSAQHYPNFAEGRTTIVHLFEWRWNDIAEECERFLGPYGYGGVQTSPVNENAVITNPFRPWWERYQPVSYELNTRSGTQVEFRSMVQRCNAVGVRIYVDAVINHMTGPIGMGYGTGGCRFDSDTDTLEYDCVPYSITDFNNWNTGCHTESGSIEDYTNREQVRNCQLSGLRDLNQGVSWVKVKIADFLNKLIGMGVAGFRIDAAKHMWPGDMELILNELSNLPTEHGFPAGARPFLFQEVIEQDTEPVKGSEYFGMGRVTEFKVGRFLGQLFRGHTQLKWLINWGMEGEDGWLLYPDNNALVFVDNHDNQRGHGGGGDTILTFRLSRWYKMATAFLLAHPHGVTRVMSSYFWEQDIGEDGKDRNDWVGPPNTNGVINPVPINPDLTCGGGWICEHRWRQIYNMVGFRNAVQGTWFNDFWSNDNNQISFCRGDKGFIAINNDVYPLVRTMQTCLPPGIYCDVISGNKIGNSCTGTSVTVGSAGYASISLSNAIEDPVLAIHIGSKI